MDVCQNVNMLKKTHISGENRHHRVRVMAQYAHAAETHPAIFVKGVGMIGKIVYVKPRGWERDD